MERRLPIRNRGQKLKCWDYPVEQIRVWIDEGGTQAWIGQQLGVSAKLIQKVCKKHGIQCQRTGPRSGTGHPDWKGGRIIDKHGYVLVYRPGHPRARKPRNVYVCEHILVAEKMLGRPLLPGEVVHHGRKGRQCNRPDNLTVYQTNGEHLHEELSGHCPKWTPDGKARILTALRQVADSRRGLTLDEYQNKRCALHLTDPHQESTAQAS